MVVKVPIKFKQEVQRVTRLDSFQADEFVRKFLSQFNDPASWLKTLDPKTVEFSIKRFYRLEW